MRQIDDLRQPIGQWGIISLAVVVGIALTTGLLTTTRHSLPPLTQGAMVASLGGLVALQIVLGHPALGQALPRWFWEAKQLPLLVGVACAGLLFLLNLIQAQVNPYSAAAVGISIWAILSALRAVRDSAAGFTAVDLLAWLMLWIPFDLRWLNSWWAPSVLGYEFWAVTITVVAVLGWQGQRRQPSLAYRIFPKRTDWPYIGLTLVLFGLTLFGLSLTVPQVLEGLSIPGLLLLIGRSLFMIAVPEELFFRGILLGGLDHTLSRRYGPLLISALAYGLMHWNNSSTLAGQAAAVVATTLFGLLLGFLYRRSGSLFVPIIIHTLADVPLFLLDRLNLPI